MGLALVEALRDRAGRRFECPGGAVPFEVFFNVNAATVVAFQGGKLEINVGACFVLLAPRLFLCRCISGSQGGQETRIQIQFDK